LENTSAMGALLLQLRPLTIPVLISLSVEEANEFPISSLLNPSTLVLYDIEENGTLLTDNNPALERKVLDRPNIVQLNSNTGKFTLHLVFT